MIEPRTAADAFALLHHEVTGRLPQPREVEVTGADPVLGGRFRLGAAAAACVGTATLAAADLLRARGVEPGRIAVDTRHAAVAFASQRHLRVDGEGFADWSGLSGNYRAADGWVRVHGNFAHHARAACAALAVPAERAAVAEAVARRPAIEVEEAVLARGGAAGALRTRAEWLAHPAGRAVRGQPLVAISRIGDAPRRRLPAADRPLAGVRVLDLTHVIAGPVGARVLAAHGADVLHVGAEHLPPEAPLVIDMGFGKRSAYVDLREPAGRDTLRALIADADVLIQSYRPESLAAKGFGPEELAALRPGIVAVSVSAYGRTGPWRRRRGFDSVVQLPTGIAAEGARAAGVDHPVPLPAQALDHGTGWLAAAAVITALRRQVADGGSWRVDLSLARTAAWLDGLGRLPDGVASATNPEHSDVADLLAEVDGPFGHVTHVRIPGELAAAPPRWDHPAHRDGTDPAEWW